MTKRLIICATISLTLMLGSFVALAQNNNETQWWFNVELIVFKRDLLPNNNENFGPALAIDMHNSNGAQKTAYSSNFLYLAALQKAFSEDKYRAALPLCDVNPQQTSDIVILDESLLASLLTPFDLSSSADASKRDLGNDQPVRQHKKERLSALTNEILFINNQLDNIANLSFSMSCVSSVLQAPLSYFILPQIGPRLFSTDSYFWGTKQLLAQTDLVLEDFAKNIFRQRDITPLLHTAWRQEVEFGIENAEFIRVRAGKLLVAKNAQSFEQWQQAYEEANPALVQNDDARFFKNLKDDLQNLKSIEWLEEEPALNDEKEIPFSLAQQYEIEGKIKVYLDYVSQVPYLHIDSEFNHFSLAIDENGNSELMAFPSKQRRRIISRQIHYFDHPAFGVIVHLERFTPPISDTRTLDNVDN